MSIFKSIGKAIGKVAKFAAPILTGGTSTVLGSIVSSVGSSLIGGLVNKSAAKAERGMALEDQASQFVRLRDAAEAAGFNPLTVLRNAPSSGMVQQTSPVLASSAILGGALGEGIKTWFNRDQIKADAERDLLERSLMRAELGAMNARANPVGQRFGFEIPTANNTTGIDPAFSGNTGRISRPRARPDMVNTPRIPVFAPDGQTMMIPISLARQMKYKAWDYVQAGDYNQMVGEISGEVENVAVRDKIGDALGMGIFGPNPDPRPGPLLSSGSGAKATPGNRSSVWLRP